MDAKGVAWRGDEATMKSMPLSNMLALCEEEPPVVISIFDCSDHMSEGGERMHRTKGSYLRKKIAKFDPSSTCMDEFFIVPTMFKNWSNSLCNTSSDT